MAIPQLRAWWVRNEQRIGAWASIVGLTLYVVSAGFLNQIPSSTREWIYASGVVLVCLGGALVFFVLSLRLSRRAKYAEVMENVRKAVQMVTQELVAQDHSR